MNEDSVKEKRQAFYFNDKDELVVESNFGLYINGEPFHKIAGTFSCNAQTMARIIAIYNERSMEVVEKYGYMVAKDSDVAKRFMAAVNSYEDAEEAWQDEIDAAKAEIKKCAKEVLELNEMIDNYNRRGALYRLFHKMPKAE